MKTVDKRMPWILFCIIVIILIVSFAIIYQKMQAQISEVQSQYKILDEQIEKLQNENYLISQQVSSAKSDSTVIEYARKYGYANPNELVLQISFPFDFDENSIYKNEKDSPFYDNLLPEG